MQIDSITQLKDFSLRGIQPSERLQQLQPYVFSELAQLKAELKPEQLIDLSLGSPDSPTPQPILQAILQRAQLINNHGYPPFDGKVDLRRGIIKWYKERFGVQLNERQVLPLLGSKEGLAHLALAYLNPGDVVLVPDPHYPVHERGCVLAGADIHSLPLYPQNDFLPELAIIPKDIATRAKMLILNYPHNPTGAIATEAFLQEAVDFCRQHQVIYCNDLAYSEIGFAGHKPQSIFEYMPLEEPGIEFFTFSKTYHMAGWRIGFCVGNEEIVQTLYKMKSNMDYGVSGTIQDGALEALQMPASYYQELATLYEKRVLLCHQLLSEELEWQIFRPGGAMYLWVPAPRRYNGDGYAYVCNLLRHTGVVSTPGSAFGEQGRGYVRLAMVQPEDKLAEAMQRMIAYEKEQGSDKISEAESLRLC